MLLEHRQLEPEPDVERPIVAQAAAICLTASAPDAPHVVLVRSRRTGRWGLPKGGIEPGEVSSWAAQREAFEEAGVTGIVCSRPIGHFAYEKEGSCTRYEVAVHVLLNDLLANHYPEQQMRERGYFPLAEAIDLITHPQVRRILAMLMDEYRGR
ncbi:NUDIX hydrolase [Rhizobium mayense]|uniref:NUDIX hydrolase n=1 Tax=Rhizobium mayense TaxID=1312184 RepID=A0ABT7JV98_9HYPH|nr:NUDIX hydrolase [Rhizobium mayense]MDL2400275.1 NUDIX hydrolase [Rhizobium mayense]